jgi:hypothetical protein
VPRFSPVLLIGAEVLPGKLSAKGGACAIASATRPRARPRARIGSYVRSSQCRIDPSNGPVTGCVGDA